MSQPRQRGAGQREGDRAALGTGEQPPGPRGANIVNLADVEGEYGGISKRLAAPAGATQTGLNWDALPPNDDVNLVLGIFERV